MSAYSYRRPLRMLVAIAVGTAVSATVGSISLLLGSVIAGDEVPDVWRTWWLGDATGALIVLPLALAWATLPPRSWWRWRGLRRFAQRTGKREAWQDAFCWRRESGTASSSATRFRVTRRR